MSYPNLLEYHLLSSCPPVDSSPSVCLFQGRFAYALRYLGCPKYFHSDVLPIHSPIYIDYCAMFYEVFATLPFNYFSLKSVGLFRPKFSRCATAFQPVNTNIIQQIQRLIYKDFESKMYRGSRLSRRGFIPNYFGN